MHITPPPDSRVLLPPLLACLPTAQVSSRPPPALLPLLSPVLRQRLSYLTENTGSKSWLQLLSWSPERAAKLPGIVERIDLEPHPVSGELEIEDIRPAKYQRLDEETLHARLEAEQFELVFIYVWCEKDEHGGTEPGWKLAELRALGDMDDGTQWFDSSLDADEAAAQHDYFPNGDSVPEQQQKQQQEDDEDNDDYWAAYDRTPGQTPAPAGQQPPNPHSNHPGRQMADAQYYARYGAEVQPALDAHDPDEALSNELDASTLRGDSLLHDGRSNGFPTQQQQPQSSLSQPTTTITTSAAPPVDAPPLFAPQPSLYNPSKDQDNEHLSMPRPISPASSHSSVERLEEQAEAMSSQQQQDAGDVDDRAQRGIKMHISTDIKSLFRLARSSGMTRSEFERVIQRELDVLSLLEADE